MYQCSNLSRLLLFVGAYFIHAMKSFHGKLLEKEAGQNLNYHCSYVGGIVTYVINHLAFF